MSEVPRARTTPTTAEWRDAMLTAAARLRLYLDDRALSVFWAQWALETGRGSSCFNNNLGNIKHVDGDGRDWMWLDTFEYVGGKRVNLADKFRAFATLADGAADYLAFLSRPAYAFPWAFAIVGDADGFARALRVKGYYTAPVEEYAHGLKSLAAEYLRSLRDTDPAPAPSPPDTRPETPTSRSSQRLAAATVPIIDADDGRAVTPLRADEGEMEPPDAS